MVFNWSGFLTDPILFLFYSILSVPIIEAFSIVTTHCRLSVIKSGFSDIKSATGTINDGRYKNIRIYGLI